MEDFSKFLVEYTQEEKEISDKLQNIETKPSIARFYGLEEAMTGIQGRATFPIYEIAAFHDPLIVLLLPYSKQDFKIRYGLSVDDLIKLKKDFPKRIEFLVSRSPVDYQNCKHMEPLLRLKPPTFYRARAFADVLCDGRFDEFVKEGVKIGPWKDRDNVGDYAYLKSFGYSDLVEKTLSFTGRNSMDFWILMRYFTYVLIGPILASLGGRHPIGKTIGIQTVQLDSSLRSIADSVIPICKKLKINYDVAKQITKKYNIVIPERLRSCFELDTKDWDSLYEKIVSIINSNVESEDKQLELEEIEKSGAIDLALVKISEEVRSKERVVSKIKFALAITSLGMGLGVDIFASIGIPLFTALAVGLNVLDIVLPEKWIFQKISPSYMLVHYEMQ